MDRRRVLEILGGLATAVIGVALAVPAALMASGRRAAPRERDRRRRGAARQLPEGVPVRVAVTVPRRRDAWNLFTNVTLGAAWLVREGDGVRAFSTVCPHAGCAVDFAAAQKKFDCPCHGSVFSLDGARRTGRRRAPWTRWSSAWRGGACWSPGGAFARA